MGEEGYGALPRSGPSISLVLINRGGRIFRQEILEDLQNHGFLEILSLEEPGNRLDAEGLLKRFPHLRFLLLQSPTSPGEQINMAMEEAKGDLVLVLWNDQALNEASFSPRLQKILSEPPVLCWVPEIRTKTGEEIPTLMTPSLYRKNLKILALSAEGEFLSSLFPYDYAGIYHRQKFLQSAGYDFRISNPYWQKLDFGLRAYMWGEKILQLKGLRVQYLSDMSSEDRSLDDGYKIFFLKNLIPVFSGDSAVLPRSAFLSFWPRSGQTLFSAWRDFERVREWVREHRYRFKFDARGVTELWGSVP